MNGPERRRPKEKRSGPLPSPRERAEDLLQRDRPDQRSVGLVQDKIHQYGILSIQRGTGRPQINSSRYHNIICPRQQQTKNPASKGQTTRLKDRRGVQSVCGEFRDLIQIAQYTGQAPSGREERLFFVIKYVCSP